MTLTERVNAASSHDERYLILQAARVEADIVTSYGFYLALPEVVSWRSSGRWEIVYRVGLPNLEGGPRQFMMHSISSHAYDLRINGEEQALDFVYMLNMARINRKDGM